MFEVPVLNENNENKLIKDILDYVEKLGEKLSELYEPELAKEIVSELN